MGVGGAARFFAAATSVEELREALAWAKQKSLPLFVLGGGSNLVFADSGWPGLVLKVDLKGIEFQEDGGIVRLLAGAGEEWDTAVSRSVAQGCAGLETLSGIPGSVGGTPVQNVGAYGAEVSTAIASVEALEIASGELCRFANCECGFAYRASRFNREDKNRYIITRVVYALRAGGEPRLEYAELQRYFAEGAGRGSAVSLASVRAAVLAIRRRKSMVYDPDDLDSHSSGSFFKNPVVAPEIAEKVRLWAEARGLRAPIYPAADGAAAKLSAAWLIEQSGVSKGFTMGAVAVSSKHALALTNRGGASAAGLMALKEHVQASVRQAFGIELQVEPVLAGF